MNEETAFGQEEKFESKNKSSQTWVVRCSAEQKEFFQRATAESRLPAPEFIFKALTELGKEDIEDEDLKKIVGEVKFYSRKIENIIISSAIMTEEKKKLFEAGLLKTQQEQEKSQQALTLAREIAKEEYLQKEEEYLAIIEKEKQEFKNKYEEELKELRSRFMEEVDIKEKMLSQNEQLKRDVSAFTKEVEHTKKYSHSLEEKSDTLARKIMELEGKNKSLLEKEKNYEALLEKNRELEKNLALAVAQIENEKLKARLEIQDFQMHQLRAQFSEDKRNELDKN